MEAFRKFTKITTLNIKVYFGEGDGNLTNIVNLMMLDEEFPWFKTVRTLKCYEINQIDSKEDLQLFYTWF